MKKYFVIAALTDISDEVIRTVHENVGCNYVISTMEHPTWSSLGTMAENGVQLALERGDTVYGVGITGERNGCTSVPNSVQAVCEVLDIDMTPRQKSMYGDVVA